MTWIKVAVVPSPKHPQILNLIDCISPAGMIPRLESGNKEALLEELSRNLASRLAGVDGHRLGKALLDRENLGSTALRDGFAVPHAKLEGVSAFTACLGRSPEGIPFGAVDGALTHLFLAVVSPSGDVGTHLELLAQISQLFKRKSTHERLMQAADADAMYRVILEMAGTSENS